MDSRTPRDGRVLEELGTYDPMIPDTDARVTLNHDRVAHWLSVGALPTEKMAVLIKKYGPGGTHVEQNQAARQRMLMAKSVPPAPKPVVSEPPQQEESSAEKPATEEMATEKSPVTVAETASEVTAEPDAAEGESTEPGSA